MTKPKFNQTEISILKSLRQGILHNEIKVLKEFAKDLTDHAKAFAFERGVIEAIFMNEKEARTLAKAIRKILKHVN